MLAVDSTKRQQLVTSTRPDRAGSESNPFAAGELQFDIQRHAAVLFRVSIHVIEQRVPIASLLLAAAGALYTHVDRPAGMDHVTAPKRIMLGRLHLTAC